MTSDKIDEYLRGLKPANGDGTGSRLGADAQGIMRAIGYLADALSERRSGLSFLAYLRPDNLHQAGRDFTEHMHLRFGGGAGASPVQGPGSEYNRLRVVVYAKSHETRERYLVARPGDAVGVLEDGRVVIFREQPAAYDPAEYEPWPGDPHYEVAVRNPQREDTGGEELTVTFETRRGGEEEHQLRPGVTCRKVLSYGDGAVSVRVAPAEAES